ncbi:hypothetical protein ACFL96_14860 [Thermoproteota archaeon]
MISDLLKEVNERGLDLVAVITKAEEMGMLRGNGIAPDKVDAVLNACDPDYTATPSIIPEKIAEEPIQVVLNATGAVDLAKNMDIPLSPSDWNTRAQLYAKHLKKKAPKADELIKEYSTWEEFWKAAGFDMEEYSARDIINLTVDTTERGFLPRKQFDSTFPDMPSSSLVLELFGNEWRNYSGAVSRARKKLLLPAEMIDELLSEGEHTIKKIEKQVVDAFKKDAGIHHVYRRKSNKLYTIISERKKELEEEAGWTRLSRDDLRDDYSTLELIADTKIKGFRNYPGQRKAEKRKVMPSDVKNYLIDTEERKLSYLGLEGINFTSYILLQNELESIIDPKTSLVGECNASLANAMRTIIENHDAIEGGEIFEGLALEKDYLHNSIERHKDKQFDILNLDYMGGWSSTKERVLDSLFENGQIADKALVYVTLLNSSIEQFRIKNGWNANGMVRKGYGTSDQKALLKEQLETLCEKHDYKYTQLECSEYFDTQKMLFFGFYLERKEE